MAILEYISYKNMEIGLSRTIPCNDVSLVVTTYLVGKIKRCIKTGQYFPFGIWRIKVEEADETLMVEVWRNGVKGQSHVYAHIVKWPAEEDGPPVGHLEIMAGFERLIEKTNDERELKGAEDLLPCIALAWSIEDDPIESDS